MADAELTSDLAAAPLFADLDAAELADFIGGMRHVSYAPGEEVIRQGAPPDGVFVTVSGRVEILTKLPGGGENLIAVLEPESTVGELALIGQARRTATVRALDRVEALYVDAQVFRAALVQLRPAAIKVLRRLALTLSARMRTLHGGLREAAIAGDRAWMPVALSGAPTELLGQGAADADFDAARFLPILRCFHGFAPEQIRLIAERGELVALPRGSVLLSAGSPPDACYILVRGAIAVGFVEGEQMHQIAILGPGCFCAVDSVIEDLPASASYLVRESAHLLRLPRGAFRDLYGATDRLALNLLHSVNENQADMVARANNHLTRLQGLARLGRQLGRFEERSAKSQTGLL